MKINYIKNLNDGSLKIAPIGFWKAIGLSFVFDFIFGVISIPMSIFTEFILLMNSNLNWVVDIIYYSTSFVQQYGVLLVIIVLINKSFNNTDPKLKEGKITRKKYLAGAGMIIGYIFITYGIFDMFLYSLPTFNEGLYEYLEEYLINTPYILIFIETCVMAPIFEEILYRGIFLNGLLKKYNYKKAIIFSALIFAIAHLNLPQGINAFFLGIIIGLVYYYTSSVYLCISMHFVNNFLVNFIIYPETSLWTIILYILIPIIGLIIYIKSYKIIRKEEEIEYGQKIY